MLTAQVINNELSWQGEVLPGDVYPGYCCPGYGWEVVLTFPDSNPGYISIWGRCHNPNCPDFDGSEDDPYQGVSNILQEDFAENLAEGKVRHPAPTWDDPASIKDFFTGPASTGKDPYEAFGEWAKEHGYDVEEDDQLQAALEVYGGE